MSKFVLVAAVAAFVGTIASVSGAGHAAEVPGSKAVPAAFIVAPLPAANSEQVEKVVVGPLLRWALPWILKEAADRAKIAWGEFKDRLCAIPEFRKNISNELASYWIVRKRYGDSAGVNTAIFRFAKCEINVLARVSSIEEKVDNLTKAVAAIRVSTTTKTEPGTTTDVAEIVEGLKKIMVAKKDFEDATKKTDDDLGKLGREIRADITEVADGINKNIAEVKADLDVVRKGLTGRQQPLHVKPRHLRKHRPLVPCACSSGETSSWSWWETQSAPSGAVRSSKSKGTPQASSE